MQRPETKNPSDLRYRSLRAEDGGTAWELATQVGLDENSPYAYALWGEYFSDSSLIAETPGGDVAGFVTGFRPPAEPSAVFVWQIGVDPSFRRQGVAAQMLDALVERTGADVLEATVTPSNDASAGLFRAFGDRHGAEVAEEIVFPAEVFPGEHEAEVRFRIGPLR